MRLLRLAAGGRHTGNFVTVPFVHELRVRYGECDPQGIVFNANYLLYFDVAFTELWRAAVGPWQEMVDRGVDAVVAESNVRFHSPARFDDELRLPARVARLGRSSITTQIDVMRGEELLVAGQLRHVCVSTWSSEDISSPAKIDMPDWVRSGLERFLIPA
jgi:acyl-CoA thioester hydrolase